MILAKFANVGITEFRQCRDLVRERKVFIEYEAYVESRVCGIEFETGVLYLGKLLFKSDQKKFGLRRVEGEQIRCHPGEDLV